MDWSEQKVPKECGPDDEEEKLTEEQKTAEEADRPVRRIGASPLCTDGKLIYAMSMNMNNKKEENGGQTLMIDQINLEVFQFEDDERTLKQTKVITLKKKDDQCFVPKKLKFTTDGGWLNHA